MSIDKAFRDLLNNVSAETLNEMPEDDLIGIVKVITNESEEDVSARVKQICSYRRELARLRAIPLIAQRTHEWYELRKQRLTASDTAQAIGRGKFGTRKQLLQKKILESQGKSAPFRTVPAMKWGIMFEPMAMRIYQDRNDNISVYEFGLIPHPTLDCYGASPDGISELGIMIEIKCPYRRQITGEIPDYYELQMQGQMAVCGLSECDYIECDMQTYNDEIEYFVEVGEDCVIDHGVICEFTRDGSDDIWYEYSDPLLTARQAVAWAREYSVREMRRDKTINLVKLHMWRLRNVHIQRIFFNQKRWEEELAPNIQQFWDEVKSCPTVKYKFIPDPDE
jgi:putative phage-type endonuclease